MSAPGSDPAGATGPGDRPRPATNPPRMNAPSPNPAGTSGPGDRPRPAMNPPNMRRNLAGAYTVPTYHTTHGSYATVLGEVNNNATIGSAATPTPDRVNPQPTTNQFISSSGSYATVPIQQYQTFGHLETHQPIINSPATDDDRAFQQALDDFTRHREYYNNAGDSGSDLFPEKSAMSVNSPQNTYSHPKDPQQLPNLVRDTAQPLFHQGQPSKLSSDYPRLPPPYSSTEQHSSMPKPNSSFTLQSLEHQPMHYSTAQVSKVSTQHDAPSRAAHPQTYQDILFANGRDGHSGGNTQITQESMPQTQTNLSTTKKRRRPKISGGSPASSGENPKAKKMRATATKRKLVDYAPTVFGQGVYTDMSADAIEERLTK